MILLVSVSLGFPSNLWGTFKNAAAGHWDARLPSSVSISRWAHALIWPPWIWILRVQFPILYYLWKKRRQGKKVWGWLGRESRWQWEEHIWQLEPCCQVIWYMMALLSIFRGKFTLGFFSGHKGHFKYGSTLAEKPHSSGRNWVSCIGPSLFRGVTYFGWQGGTRCCSKLSGPDKCKHHLPFALVPRCPRTEPNSESTVSLRPLFPSATSPWPRSPIE